MTTAPALDGTPFNQDLHKLNDGLHTLRTDVGAVAHEAGDALRSGAAQVQHAAHNAVDSAKHRIQDAEKNAEKYVSNAADSLKELVVRHPVTSVSIAAGVGLLIGSLFLRARG
jgi:ElaB/YqjD/DUF883 family membrane-anchored ribosome-binding protein